MPLRPALKAFTDSEQACSSPFPFSSCNRMHDSHVHFPPTPILTSTALTHSPNAYDRAPIPVSPNSCALPERGSRVYRSPDAGQVGPPSAKESYFLPRSSGPDHSLQSWCDGSPSLRSLSHNRYDLSASSLIADLPSDSEDCDEKPPLNVSHVSLLFGTSSDPGHLDETSPRRRTTSLLNAGFALASLPPADSNVEDGDNGGVVSAKKKKKPRLRAVEKADETATTNTYRRSLLSCDPPALEGCLGGF